MEGESAPREGEPSMAGAGARCTPLTPPEVGGTAQGSGLPCRAGRAWVVPSGHLCSPAVPGTAVGSEIGHIQSGPSVLIPLPTLLPHHMHTHTYTRTHTCMVTSLQPPGCPGSGQGPPERRRESVRPSAPPTAAHTEPCPSPKVCGLVLTGLLIKLQKP